VYSLEIERSLAEHPAMRECAVLVVEYEHWLPPLLLSWH